MKPPVVFGFLLGIAMIAIGCNSSDAPLKINAGDSVVTFNVAGAT